MLVGDVDQAIAEKRASQFGKINQRLQPADYKRETFKGRTAHKFDDKRLKQVSDFVEHMREEYAVPPSSAQNVAAPRFSARRHSSCTCGVRSEKTNTRSGRSAASRAASQVP